MGLILESSTWKLEPDLLGGWETIYEVDLTAQGTSATANTDWPRNLTGSRGELVSWSAGNNTLANEMKLVSGTGMRIVIDSTKSSGHWENGSPSKQTGPVIYAPIDNIYTAAGLTYDWNETFAFQTLHEFTVTTAGSDDSIFYGGSMILDGTTGEPTAGGTSAGNYMQSSWITTSSATPNNQWFFRNGSMQQTGNSGTQFWITDSVADAARPTFCEIVFYPGASWSSRAGVYSTFQTPLTVTDHYAYGSMARELPIDMGTNGSPWVNTTANPGQTTQFLFRPGTTTSEGRQINVGVSAAYRTNATRDSKITCLWKKLRVLRRGG
jgi:hypothetical protein